MKIRTKVEFSGVPQWTTGNAEKDGKLWKITWDLTHHMSGRPRLKPLQDWFDQKEFDQFLEII